MSNFVSEKQVHEQMLGYTRHGDFESLKSLFASSNNVALKLVNKRSLETGRSLLHEASALGHKDIVKFLLHTTTCDVSAKTFLGRAAPLHLAAANGNRSIVFLLLSNGANPVAQDRFGNSPLHLATTRNCARLIIEYGGELMIFNKWKKDAEQVARERDPENKELLEYLHEIGTQEYLKMQRELKREKLMKRQSQLRERLGGAQYRVNS